MTDTYLTNTMLQNMCLDCRRSTAGRCAAHASYGIARLTAERNDVAGCDGECACAIGSRHFWHTAFCEERERLRALTAERDTLRTLAKIAIAELRARDTGAEQCICAAIRLSNGEVWRGHRHDNCIIVAGNAGVTRDEIAKAEQGFITSRNRFVGREEGARLQHDAGIVTPTGRLPTGMLFSEDLYLRSWRESAAIAVDATDKGATP